jgi:hypothetical protein
MILHNFLAGKRLWQITVIVEIKTKYEINMILHNFLAGKIFPKWFDGNYR